jgi:hypothetical protein
MIFKQYFIDLILAGKKTQTRRPNRGYYVVGKTYAIQPCRTCKGLKNHRIVIDRIWEETGLGIAGGGPAVGKRAKDTYLSEEDAFAEGGYTPKEFEELFLLLSPRCSGWSRWAFEFHVEEVQK